MRAITVVVPCFNEEDVIPVLAPSLRRIREDLAPGYAVRVLFVDDGSTDGTVESLERAFSGCRETRIVRHPENRGIAAAILTGVREAETEVVCSIDSDCSYDVDHIARLLPHLEIEVDLVTASPYHPEGRVEGVPAWRLALSRGLSRLYRFTLRQPLHTYTSCFRVYRRSAMLDLDVQDGGFPGVAEMLGLLLLRGGNVAEVPAVLKTRTHGVSKLNVLRVSVGHVRLLARLWRLKLAGGG